MDKTRLSCLVHVGSVKTIGDKTTQFCLVSTKFPIWVLSHFPICHCSVSNTLRTSENLEIESWVKTRQNCLVLSPIVFTPSTPTSLVRVGRVNKLQQISRTHFYKIPANYYVISACCVFYNKQCTSNVYTEHHYHHQMIWGATSKLNSGGQFPTNWSEAKFYIYEWNFQGTI